MSRHSSGPTPAIANEYCLTSEQKKEVSRWYHLIPSSEKRYLKLLTKEIEKHEQKIKKGTD